MPQVLGLLLIAARVFAADFALAPNENVSLSGEAATITILPANGNVAGFRNFTEAGWSVSRHDNAVWLQAPEPSNRAQLSSVELKNKPSFDILLPPGHALDLHLRDGNVILRGGTSDVSMTLRNGRVSSTAHGGSLKVGLLKGDVTVLDGTGTVDIDLYQGNVLVKNSQLDGDVQVFGGAFNLEQCRGRLNLETRNAVSHLQKFVGDLQLNNGKGSLNATGLQGHIEGVSNEGALSLGVQNESDVHLKTQSGRVQLSLPPSSGASLNLTTTEGEIVAPSDVPVTRTHLEKSAKGHVKGEHGKLSVVVRSQEGSIVVK